MLEPADRTVFTESLRPPPGFRLDRVVSTTYTLDLVALLTLPLSFTLLAGDGVNESGRVDPIALLEALRRYAGRLHVFCESGRIAVPRRGQLLFGYLEQSVIEAKAPKKGGAFHPKVTVVRFTLDPSDPVWNDDDRPGDDAVRYRLLCGTRNLTFDRSWDTMLALDGELATNRTLAYGRNRPLSRFIKALPGFAVRSMPEPIVAAIDQVADELLRVQFEPPEGFGVESEDLAFWPIGLDDKEVWPFDVRTDRSLDRLLVVSPFVDKTCIDWLKDEGKLCALVSRSEELDKIPQSALDGIAARYILANAAETEPAEQDSPAQQDGTAPDTRDSGEDGVPVEPSDAQLRGLHAKLFVADAGWNARIWTGSANATRAAFNENLEFLVELRGKKSQFGIDALLGSTESEDSRDRQIRFRDLLVPYHPPDEARPEDATQKKLEEMLEESRRAVVDSKLIARVAEAGPQSARVYDVRIEATVAEGGRLPNDVECSMRPISLSLDHATRVTALSGEVAKFDSLAFESLTGFYAVNLMARAGGRRLGSDFALSVPLIGGPPDRQNRLLLAMLSNRERLFRYLLMLLDGPDAALRKLQGNGSGGMWSDSASFGPFGLPLLEPLLRALAEDPARLAPVERLVRDLESTDDGKKLLPEEFVTLWASIRSLIPPPQDQPAEEAHASS